MRTGCVSRQELNQCWIIFPLMSFVEATVLWQEGTDKQSRSLTHLREKATNQLVCPWCFKLMITPWCKGGQGGLCLLLVICTLHLCPLMVKYTNVFRHLLKAPSSSLLSFLIWSLPPHCSTAMVQLLKAEEVGTPGFSNISTDIVLLPEYLKPNPMAIWRQWWCGMVW